MAKMLVTTQVLDNSQPPDCQRISVNISNDSGSFCNPIRHAVKPNVLDISMFV